MQKLSIAIALAMALTINTNQTQAQTYDQAWVNYFKQDTDKAIQQFSNKADTDAKSAFITYLLKKEAAKTKAETKEANEWLNKAADMGSPEALYTLAINDYHNEDKLVSGIKIISRLQKAAAAGLPQANLALGVLYTLSDEKHIHNVDKGLKYINKAHNQGNKFATMILGLLNVSDLEDMGLKSDQDKLKQDPQKGLKYLESALSEDFVWPAIILADIYENGANGIDPNPEKAQEFDDWISDNFFDFIGSLDITDPEEITLSQMLNHQEKQDLLAELNKEANNGNATSARTLANIYAQGKLGKRNQTKAIDYYKQAAALNDAKSIMALAKLSKGQEKLDYLEQAAKLNYVPALRSLSETYNNPYWSGIDVEEDKKLALEYMEKAANAGDFQSQIDMAELYSEGQYADIEKSKEWLEQSIKEHPEQASKSYLKLADLYYYEEPNQYNQKQSFQYLTKAMQAGDKTGQAAYLLGNLYEEGIAIKANAKKALELYKQAAHDQEGSYVYEKAKLAMANIYINGTGNVAKDTKKSINILKELADDDVPEAIYLLGESYRTGNGVAKNHEKAKEYYEEIAEHSDEAGIRLKLIELNSAQGDEYEQIHQEILELADNTYDKDVLNDVYAILKVNDNDLDWLYSESITYGNNGDALQALKQYATDQDLPIGHYYYGLALLKDDKTAKIGIGEIKKAANADHYKAMRKLGNLYLGQYGFLDVNEELALKWLHKAADSKDADEKVYKDLGDIYYSGLENTAKNYETALTWYSKISSDSIENDDYYYNVANHIDELKEANLNINEAQQLYKQGDMDAAYRIAQWHIHNKYGLSNQEKAFELLTEAANNNNADALWFLADDNHFADKISEQQRTKYYLTAAQNGKVKAMQEIGQRYLNGIGTKINRQQAKYWFTKANYSFGLKLMDKFEAELAKAKQNDTKANFRVGLYYKQGTGTAQDYDKAKQYFEAAAKADEQMAKLELAKMYLKGLIGKVDWQQAISWAKQATDYDQAKEYINYYEDTVKPAEDGDLKAMTELANDYLDEFYIYRYSPTAQFEYAQNLLDAAIAKKDGFAAYLKANSFIDERSPYYQQKNAKEKYLHYLKLAVNYDYAAAKVDYGDYLGDADNLKDDQQKQIISLYKEALKQDNYKALIRLVDLYYYGSSNGFEPQVDKVESLLEKSCDYSQFSACKILAKAYAYGDFDFTPDGNKAIALLKTSMDNNDLEAYLIAGNIYIDGSSDLPADWKQADIYFQKANQIGLQQLKQEVDEYIPEPDRNLVSATDIATTFMAGLRSLGDNASKSQIAITAKWQEQAVQAEGYMDLATNLAIYYKSIENYDKAFYYYLLSEYLEDRKFEQVIYDNLSQQEVKEVSEQAREFRTNKKDIIYKPFIDLIQAKAEKTNDPSDWYRLARIYMDGEFAKSDDEKAKELLKIAADKGHKEAKLDLERMAPAIEKIEIKTDYSSNNVEAVKATPSYSSEETGELPPPPAVIEIPATPNDGEYEEIEEATMMID